MSVNTTPPDDKPDDGQLDDYRSQFQDEVPEEEPKSSGNRTFLTIIGVIGAVVVLAIIALVIYFLITKGQLTNRFQEQAAQINAENTAVAMQATQAVLSELQQMTEKAILPATWTPTATRTLPPTASPTNRATNTPAPTNPVDAAARTATSAAFLTQNAAQGGVTTGTVVRSPTALPSTGFAEDVSLPGMLGLAVGLIVIVFAARKLRLSAIR